MIRGEEKKAIFIGLKIGVILIVLIFAYLILMSNVKITATARYIEINESYEIDKNSVTAELFGADVSGLLKSKGIVDTEISGENEVIHYISIFPFKNVRQSIYVGDWTNPELKLFGDSEITLEYMYDFEEAGFQAIDNQDGDITSKVETNIKRISDNEYHIQYMVSDTFGNTTIKERVLYVKKITGVVYLTFDDGPSSSVTPKILDVLKEKGITATFFVVGFNKERSAIVERTFLEGNTIGLHGYSHEYKEIYTSVDTLMNNFMKLEKLVENTTGYKSKYIRFPGGSSNTVSKKYCRGIMTQAVKQVEENGYRYYDWNVDSDDAGSAKTAEDIYKNVINGVKPGIENIVLMHDSVGHEATLEALPEIIEYLFMNGYSIRALNENSDTTHHKVSN